MHRRHSWAVLSLVLLAGIVTGCNVQYLVEFKDYRTGQPLAGVSSKAISYEPLYSFLDIRHYISACCQDVTVRGRTDQQGRWFVELPEDRMGILTVYLNEQWVLWKPTDEWQRMGVQSECEGAALLEGGDPPMVRVRRLDGLGKPCTEDGEVRHRNSVDANLMYINLFVEQRERMLSLVRSGYSTNEAVSQILVEEWEKDSATVPDYIKRTPEGRWHLVDPKGIPYVLNRSSTGVVSLPN